MSEQVLSTIVSASFSQFYLRCSEILAADAIDAETSVTQGTNPGEVLFTSPIQDADLKVDVRIFDSRPPALNGTWNDVVEFSFRAGAESRLTGWEEEPEDLRLPLAQGKPYRLRYGIANMDTARTDHPGPVDPDAPLTGLIAIDLWPAEILPAETLVQKTKAGRYWLISHGLEHLRLELYRRQAETTETERITEFADRAFTMFPDLVQQTIDSNAKRLLSTVWMLHGIPVAEATGLNREDQAGVRERAEARISEVLLQRARLAQH